MATGVLTDGLLGGTDGVVLTDIIDGLPADVDLTVVVCSTKVRPN